MALSAEAPYRHAFQGMRLLEGAGGLAEYRTPFRLYDGRTGRWAGLDPVLDPVLDHRLTVPLFSA